MTNSSSTHQPAELSCQRYKKSKLQPDLRLSKFAATRSEHTLLTVTVMILSPRAGSLNRNQSERRYKTGSLPPMCFRCARSTFTSLPSKGGRALIRVYRYTLSPLIGFHCRHMPTCSQYGDEALARFGLWAGGWMTLARLLRCHPWGTSGIDNVPDRLPGNARWFLPWRYARWRGVNDLPG